MYSIHAMLILWGKVKDFKWSGPRSQENAFGDLRKLTKKLKKLNLGNKIFDAFKNYYYLIWKFVGKCQVSKGYSDT